MMEHFIPSNVRELLALHEHISELISQMPNILNENNWNRREVTEEQLRNWETVAEKAIKDLTEFRYRTLFILTRHLKRS